MAILTVLLSACADAGPPASDWAAVSRAREPAGSGAEVCRSVTVRGDVFYNDQRRFGRFHLHATPGGDPGRQYKLGDEDTGATHGRNDLSLIDATVEVHEIDRLANGAGCYPHSFVGSTTTDASGHYEWSGQVCDACASDDLLYESQVDGTPGVSLGIQVSLRYCPDDLHRCFSVKQPLLADALLFDEHGDGAVTWSLWHPSASLSAPRRVFVEDATLNLADFSFEGDGTNTDLALQAAMVFQGLAEAARRLHLDLGVPFRRAEFGEVEAIFPMKWLNHGAGHSHEHRGRDYAQRVCIAAPGTGGDERPDEWIPAPGVWGDHTTELHEYGHIVNYRAWEGYGKYVDINFSGCLRDVDGDGVEERDCTAEQDSQEHPAAAFKENFADFMRRAVLNDVPPEHTTLDYGGCAYDRPPVLPPLDQAVMARGIHTATSVDWDRQTSGAVHACGSAPCALGERSPEAVEHLLCDLIDGYAEAPRNPSFLGADNEGPGGLSALIGDLQSAWSEAEGWQRDVYIAASLELGPEVQVGIGLCDLMRRRVARAPETTASVIEVLSLNGIDCSL